MLPCELLTNSASAHSFRNCGGSRSNPSSGSPTQAPSLLPKHSRPRCRCSRNHDGRLLTGVTVTSITPRTNGGVRVESDAGEFDADVAVVAAGPWAGQLLASLGIHVDAAPGARTGDLCTRRIKHGEDGWQQRPCVIDVPADASSFGFYAMPTPGIGYKVGLDDPLRDFDPARPGPITR